MAYRDDILATSGIKAYWRLDETSGSIASDETGNGYDGAYQGNVSIDQPGLITAANAAAYFSGSEQYLEVSTIGAHLGAAGAIELWIAPDYNNSDSVNRFFFDARADNTNYLRGQLYTDGNFYIGWTHGGTDERLVIPSADLPIAAGQTSHIVVAWDTSAGYTKVFHNGAEVSSGVLSATADVSGVPLKLAGGDSPGNGTFDEIAVYTRALTAQEISNHYTAGTTAQQLYTLSGTVTADGNAAEATVRAYNWNDGAFVAETVSDPGDGTYAITDLGSNADLMVVTLPSSGLRPLAHGPVTPMEQ